MSETLRVTLDGHHLSASGEEDLLHIYQTVAKTVISPAMVSSVRLIFRHEPHGTTIEPFLGSAAFEALLRIPKKRDESVGLLVGLVTCAFLVCKQVGLLFVGEGRPLPRERTDLALPALREQHRLKNAWYRIVASLSWFHFSQVEAKLLQPLRLSSGELASHYFREFWVRAVERQVAYGAVTTAIEKDGAMIVAFGDVAPSEPPIEGSEDWSNIVTRGRVYFSDQGH